MVVNSIHGWSSIRYMAGRQRIGLYADLNSSYRKMQMTKLQSIIIVIGYLCFAVTYGCTCQSRTSLHSYCRADWVSHLRVKLRVTKQPMPNDPLRKALTNIRYGVHHIRLYKVPPQFTNSTLPAEIFTPSEAAACGLLLEAGKEYLLTGRVRNGTLITMLCGQIIGNRSLRSSFESILEWTMVNETLRQWLERDNSANCPRTLASTTIIAHETMIGGWKEQNVDDKDLQDLSWRAMKGINEQSNDIYHLMPVKLLSAKSQVVAGMKYELEILVGQSECRKNQLSSEDVNAESCKEKAGGRRQVYIVTVWQKPWENFEQFTIKEIKEAS